MARVTGPLLSLSASGKLADAMVFSRWKGRPYVRQLVIPANPKSGGQTGMRSMFAFLSQNWSGIGATPQATWEELAEAAAVAPFNSFMKLNLLANRNFLSPYQDYPRAGIQTIDAIDEFDATAGERQITIRLTDLDVNQDNWGFLIFKSTTTGFTPAFDNLAAVILSNGGNDVFFVDTPLVPDTYYYDAKPFTKDGVLGSLDGEINAVVV